LKYFRENGTLRSKLLTPPDDPLKLFDTWSKKTGWLFQDDMGSYAKLSAANQLLNLIDSVYRRDKDEFGSRFNPDGDINAQWKVMHAEVAALNIRWDGDKNLYTFKDGSHLPAVVQKLYRRNIWKIDGLAGEGSVVVERVSPKAVWVTFEWSGKKADQPGGAAVELFSVKDKTRPLAGKSVTNVNGNAGDDVFLTKGFQVEIPEGSEVEVRMTLGKRELTSPVYTP
jgi:hypothetical protein